MKLFPVILACGSLSVAAVAGGVWMGGTPSPIAPLLAEEIEGVISAVDLEANSFSIMVPGDAAPVQISVTEKTLYTLDGATSTKEDALKIGNKARATHEEKVASSVSVTSPQ